MDKPDAPDRVQDVSRFVKARRKANRMTQESLAELAGVGRRLIVEIEKGKPTLRMDAVNAVLAVFGKTLGPLDLPRTGVHDA